MRGKIGDQSKNFGLRPHVEAAGRLIEQQQMRVGCKPLGEDDLLLISAAQRADGLMTAGDLDAQPRNHLICKARLPAWRDQAQCILQSAQVRKRNVPRDRQRKVQPLAAPVLGYESDLLPEDLGSYRRWRTANVPEQVPRVDAVEADETAQKLGSPRAQETPKAHDFAGPDIEAYVVERIGTAEALDAEHRRFLRRRRWSHSPLGIARTKHQLNDLAKRDV